MFLRSWFLCILVSVCVMAQDLTPDEEMQDLINKIEQQPASDEMPADVVEHKHTYSPSTEREKALFDRVDGYWRSAANGEWSKVYQFYWLPFRENMPLNSYLSADKAIIKGGYDIRSIKFVGDQCAQVIVSYGIEHSMMSINKISTKQPWHLDAEEWSILADPYENMMGIRPPGAQEIPEPCDFSSLRIAARASAKAKREKAAAAEKD